MLLSVIEVHLHLTGLVLRFFALPIQHALHFSTLILSDENSSNFFNNFRTFLRLSVFHKKVVSSAYAVNFMSNCFILKLLIGESPLTRINKISSAKINRYGDKGSPCLVPLSRLKYHIEFPLFMTQLCEFLNNVLIHWIKPNLFKVAKIKLWSTESKAFSISAANKIPSLFSSYAYFSKSSTRRIYSPIYLPFT